MNMSTTGATTLSPSPSPQREGSQNQRQNQKQRQNQNQRQRQQWRQMATLVARSLPSQGRVAEGREGSAPSVTLLDIARTIVRT